MSYRIRPRLWEVLRDRQRRAPWLAGQSGYTAQYIRMLRAGLRTTVSETFARKIAAVMELPIDDLFERVESPRK